MTAPTKTQVEIDQIKARMDKYDEILDALKTQAAVSAKVIELLCKDEDSMKEAVKELTKSNTLLTTAIAQLQERNAGSDRMRKILISILIVAIPAAVTIVGWFMTHK